MSSYLSCYLLSLFFCLSFPLFLCLSLSLFLSISISMLFSENKILLTLALCKSIYIYIYNIHTLRGIIICRRIFLVDCEYYSWQLSQNHLRQPFFFGGGDCALPQTYFFEHRNPFPSRCNFISSLCFYSYWVLYVLGFNLTLNLILKK